MKTHEKMICLVMSLGIIMSDNAATQAQALKTNSNISPGVTKRYFDDLAKDVPEHLRWFLNVPTGEAPLPADKHLQVCQDFAGRLRQVIKPEFIPNDAFIVAHLQLYPASPARRQDIAFLACRKGGIDYLIVQTGGLKGRVCLVTDRSDKTEVAANASAKAPMLTTITNYLNVSPEEEMPDFNIEKRGALDILKTIPPKTKRHKLTLTEGIVSNQQIAVSVDKWYFDDTPAAHEPMPDEWFESKMRSVLQKPFPNP